MKVIGFNGSPRKDGNTTTLIGYLLREIEKEGIETELVQLSAKTIHGCIACYKCFENQDQRCAVKNDAANEYIEKMTTGSGYRFGISFLFSGCNSGDEGLDRPGGLCRIGKWEDVQEQSWGFFILFSSHRRDAYHRNHEPFLL
jgi:hypothetical protein